MGYISFTDGIGAATLMPRSPATANGVLARRFRNWVPDSDPVGDSDTALGTGAVHFFRYRTDYGASFEVPYVSAHRDATYGFGLEIADRLIAHLKTGGTCTVATEDNAGASYVCGLAPGTSPSLTPTDARLLEYSLRLSVIRQDGVSAPMACRYGAV